MGFKGLGLRVQGLRVWSLGIRGLESRLEFRATAQGGELREKTAVDNNLCASPPCAQQRKSCLHFQSERSLTTRKHKSNKSKL